MPVVNKGTTNYWPTLGAVNRPAIASWGRTKFSNIGSIPSMIGGTKDRTLLPQITKQPIFPVLDRPKPVIDAIKAYVPVIERVKLFGSFGLMGQVKNRNVPVPQSIKRQGRNLPRSTATAPAIISPKGGRSFLNPQSNLPGSQLSARLKRGMFGKQYPMRNQSNLPGSQLPARTTLHPLPIIR